MNKKAKVNQGVWILIMILGLVATGMLLQDRYELFVSDSSCSISSPKDCNTCEKAIFVYNGHLNGVNSCGERLAIDCFSNILNTPEGEKLGYDVLTARYNCDGPTIIETPNQCSIDTCTTCQNVVNLWNECKSPGPGIDILGCIDKLKLSPSEYAKLTNSANGNYVCVNPSDIDKQCTDSNDCSDCFQCAFNKCLYDENYCGKIEKPLSGCPEGYLDYYEVCILKDQPSNGGTNGGTGIDEPTFNIGDFEITLWMILLAGGLLVFLLIIKKK